MLKLIKRLFLSIKYFRWYRRLKKKTHILDRQELFEKFSAETKLYSDEEKFILNFSKHQFYTRTKEKDLPQVLAYFSSRLIEVPQPFYVSVKNSQLVGKMAVAVNNDNIILESANNSIQYLNKTGDAKYLQRIKSLHLSKSKIQKAISLVNVLSNNYYHWVVDIFPILEPLYNELKLNENFKIILRSDAAAFQMELIELIGLKRNIFLWNSTMMNFKELIISANRNVFLKLEAFQTDIISQNSIEWIRECILNKLSNESPPFYDCIYISRNKSAGRKIVNEDNLNVVFDKYNINKIYLEDHSVETQILIFNKAKKIIAPHGAGLTNILFSNNLCILEFFPMGRTFFSSFHQLSAYLDHHYFQVELPAVNKNGDMKIEIDDFEEYLELIF